MKVSPWGANKPDSGCRFMDPAGQLAQKKLWHVNSVFFAVSDNSCSIALMSQPTHYYRKQCLTAVLRACGTTLSSRLRTAGDPPFPPPPCLWVKHYPASSPSSTRKFVLGLMVPLSLSPLLPPGSLSFAFAISCLQAVGSCGLRN